MKKEGSPKTKAEQRIKRPAYEEDLGNVTTEYRETVKENYKEIKVEVKKEIKNKASAHTKLSIPRPLVIRFEYNFSSTKISLK